MVSNLVFHCFLVYRPEIRISYPCVMEKLVDLVLVAYHSYWFFSEMFWVVYVIRIPVFVRCVVGVDLSDVSVGS